jgi:hypothetical protein
MKKLFSIGSFDKRDDNKIESIKFQDIKKRTFLDFFPKKI